MWDTAVCRDARPMVRGARSAKPPAASRGSESLMVNSVEKALRVLGAFDGTRRRLNLSQIAEATGLDLSAAQRFAYTLLRLGYLRKDQASRHYALSPRTLEFGRRYLQS